MNAGVVNPSMSNQDAVISKSDFLKANFFVLLGLPKSFEISLSDLDSRFRELQRGIHPDRFASADDASRRASMMLATQTNLAYQTLKSPLKRAVYLLELNGVDVQAESNTAMSPEFLMSQMMWREQVSDARRDKNLPELDRLQLEIKGSIRDAYDDLSEAFAENRLIPQAVEGVRRLMFLEKLRDETEDAIFSLEDV